MKRRPVTASAEFLETEAGRKFARAMVQEIIDQAKSEQPQVTTDDKEAAWLELRKEFCEHLDHDLEAWGGTFDEAEMHHALETSYKFRFLDLYPGDADAAAQYILRLTRIVRWLAWLTCEMWLLDTNSNFKNYPVKRPGNVRTYHLLWARESFGWWRAHLDRFVKFRLRLPRPCRCIPDSINEALVRAIDPQQQEQLEAIEERLRAQYGGVEVEEGCPLC
jgi:hypothetical protein